LSKLINLSKELKITTIEKDKKMFNFFKKTVKNFRKSFKTSALKLTNQKSKKPKQDPSITNKYYCAKIQLSYIILL
jgi:hypothetical protein